MLPTEIVDAHVAAVAPGAVECISTFRTGHCAFHGAERADGRFPWESKEMFSIEIVALVKTFPPVMIVQESEDSVTPVIGSVRFVEALKKKLPGSGIRLDVRPGGYGFDGDARMEE